VRGFVFTKAMISRVVELRRDYRWSVVVPIIRREFDLPEIDARSFCERFFAETGFATARDDEFSWRDNEQILRRAIDLAKQGLSRQKIADQLTREAGRNITRNMVIGALHRHGPADLKRKQPRRVRVTARDRPMSIPRGAISPMLNDLSSDPLSLLNVGPRQCRWPVGERRGELFVCGKPAVGRSSYCEECRKRGCA